MKDCRYFDTCSAPLCPLDVESLECGLWYPEEDVCRKSGIDWIRKQRRIKNKTNSPDKYFTHKMLIHNCRISTCGINPANDRHKEEKKWISDHPVKKQISEKKRKELSERMKKVREKKTGIYSREV